MSLLPIIRVTDFLNAPLKGGTTKPLLVLGENGKKYVLKAFSKKDSAQRSYAVAEVIANLLACEFNLKVPEAVYMTVSAELINFTKVNQVEVYECLKEKNLRGVLFASLYHEGLPIYSPAKNDKLLALDEFESIYAFDMLIANDDRRAVKPNILQTVNHYLLIDHEKAFEGTQIILENIKKGSLSHYYSRHLFYEKLNKITKIHNERVCFETFANYFRSINFKRIDENVQFLISKGYDSDECNLWVNYLKSVKQNYRIFVSLLKLKIRE